MYTCILRTSFLLFLCACVLMYMCSLFLLFLCTSAYGPAFDGMLLYGLGRRMCARFLVFMCD